MPMRMVGHLRQTMDTGSRVLLVDGDRAVRRTVAWALLGVAVCPAGSAKRALRLVAAERFAAAIVDVSLPDGDGRDLCATLRRRGLTLPIRPHELAARVRARLRQHDSSDHAELPVGEQTFRPGGKTTSRPGHPRPVRLTVRLTDKEAAVLKHLYRAQGRAVSREELLRHVWGREADLRSHALETHIHRLRRKVEPHADSPCLVVHEGGGYRLVRAGVAAHVSKAGRRREQTVPLPFQPHDDAAAHPARCGTARRFRMASVCRQSLSAAARKTSCT